MRTIEKRYPYETRREQVPTTIKDEGVTYYLHSTHLVTPDLVKLKRWQRYKPGYYALYTTRKTQNPRVRLSTQPRDTQVDFGDEETIPARGK